MVALLGINIAPKWKLKASAFTVACHWKGTEITAAMFCHALVKQLWSGKVLVPLSLIAQDSLKYKDFLKSSDNLLSFLPGSLLEVIVSVWITWCVSWDFGSCKDFGVHFRIHLAAAGAECRAEEGGLQGSPDARILSLPETTTLHLCFWLNVSCDENEQRWDTPSCSSPSMGGRTHEAVWGDSLVQRIPALSMGCMYTHTEMCLCAGV